MKPGSIVRRGARKARRIARRFVADRLRIRRRNATPRLGYVVHGEHGMHPGSTHIRVLGRVRRAVDAGLLVAERVDVAEWLAEDGGADYSVLLVQRDAVPLAQIPALLRRVGRRRIRLVVDVDDDFFSEAARARLAAQEYSPDRQRSIDLMIRHADRVLVSTETLARLVSPLTREVAVVPNELDPALWGDDASGRGASGAASGADSSAATDARNDDEPFRVLYMGTATHSNDLALLEPVFEQLRTRAGTPVRLEVVGVTEGAADWFDRLAVPEGRAHYPEFVRWLRASAPRWVAGVAPLTVDEFNAAKSDLKFLEYSLLGLPTIASSGASYDDTAPHGARVVSDDPEEWRAALAELIEDPERRAASAREGRDHVLASRMLGSTHIWERSLGLG